MLDRNKLYILFFIFCMAGYAWLFFNLNNARVLSNSTAVCIFKHVTGMACPSCGATRSVIAITNGDFENAVLINPLGYLIAYIMMIVPVWILFDLITKRNSLQVAYKKAEQYLKKPNVAIPLMLFVIINWIWNISKGL